MEEVATRRPDEPIRTRRLLNDELRHRLDVQRSSGERIETKGTVILGLATTIAPLVANAGARSGWLVPALSAFLATIGCSLMVVRIRHSWELDPTSYVEELKDVDERTALTTLTTERVAAYRRNRAELRRRIHWWRAAAACLMVGTALSAAHLWSGGW